jgi:hypothetical protein
MTGPYGDASFFEGAEMNRRTDDKIANLEKMLQRRHDLKMAAFVPGTNAETPAAALIEIVAERFGEDQARALKKLRLIRGEDGEG